MTKVLSHMQCSSDVNWKILRAKPRSLCLRRGWLPQFSIPDEPCGLALRNSLAHGVGAMPYHPSSCWVLSGGR